MPAPYEKGDIVGRLRVVSRTKKHAHYQAVCWRCRGTVTIAARSLRLKHEAVNCARCFPPKRQPHPVIVRNGRGWTELQEVAA
jgi:hypothetical protein